MATQYLDKNGLSHFWSKLKAYIKKDYDRTVSRGEQLVTNGSAMMGDNTNFSSWSYDGAEAFNSSGSFTRAQDTTRPTLHSDDYFPVNPVNTYELSVAAKSLNGLTRLYAMPVFFDADKIAIPAYTHMYRPNTLTTLAQELKNGDTVVHLTDLTNWDVDTATKTYRRGFIFWNYKNSFGYEYPENTYSRNRYYNLYTDANVNKTAKTITLTNPWNNGTFPAGTKVSQCDDGSNYKYVGWVNTTVTTEWITRAGLIGGVDFSGRNVASAFPPAAAYCKIGFLWNYNQADDKTWITNVSFKEVLVPASSDPLMDGTVAVGTSAKYAREDHRHPSDTTKVDKVTGKGLSTNDYTTEEKNKLGGIAEGAEVNQNAFSNVVVGSTTISADGKTDTLTLVAGSNVTLTPDATNDKVTIAATDTTYSNATSSAAGLMSAADKKALDLSHYGTCSVATAVKTVACTNFVLTAGAWIAVKFTVTNTAGSFTLNVNSTGAKSVSLYGSSSGLANKFLSGHTYLFIYDGSSYWQTVGDIDSGTTYSTMTQANADAGTATTGMLIPPKVLSDTIEKRAEYVAGDTLSITTGMICQGTISGATNTLSFFVPFSKACKATSCSCTKLSLLVRSYDGIPYARSGSSGGTYTQLGSSYVTVWENSASKRTNEVNSIACTPQENGMMVQISFVYNLAKASGSTSAVTANRPAAVSVQGTFTFS